MIATLVIMGGLILGLALGGPAGATATGILLYTMLQIDGPKA